MMVFYQSNLEASYNHTRVGHPGNYAVKNGPAAWY